MKRFSYLMAAMVCFGSASVAQTTSSGGQPAGNKPGTNTTGSYHHNGSESQGSVNGSTARRHSSTTGANGSASKSTAGRAGK